MCICVTHCTLIIAYLSCNNKAIQIHEKNGLYQKISFARLLEGRGKERIEQLPCEQFLQRFEI